MKLLVFLLFPTCIFAALDTTWWKNTIVYQIYIWSFKDSNGDGIGDLNGLFYLLYSEKKKKKETSELDPILKKIVSIFFPLC